MKKNGNLRIIEKSYFGLFYKIEVFDGDKKLLEKYCWDYYYDDLLIIAGNSIITSDGKCLKVLERCKEGLYLALNTHLVETQEGRKGRKSTYLVIKNNGNIILSLDKEMFFFDDLETVEKCYLTFKGDYFEIVVNNGARYLVGAYSINGTLVVPPEYIYVETDNGRFVCCKITGEKDEFSKDGVKLQ